MHTKLNEYGFQMLAIHSHYMWFHYWKSLDNYLGIWINNKHTQLKTHNAHWGNSL